MQDNLQNTGAQQQVPQFNDIQQHQGDAYGSTGMQQVQQQPVMPQQSPIGAGAGNLGRSEKQFGNTVFRLQKMPVYEARNFQLRIVKTLGSPFMSFLGMTSDDDVSQEENLAKGFSAAIVNVDPKETVDLIKDLCELTINGTKGRRTNYFHDFDADTTLDLEVALWALQEQFGNFLKGLEQSNLAADAMQILSGTQES